MSSNPLSLTLCGVPLQNPVIAASGTFGFGHEYAEMLDVSRLGGISGKGLTLRGSAGSIEQGIGHPGCGGDDHDPGLWLAEGDLRC